MRSLLAIFFVYFSLSFSVSVAQEFQFKPSQTSLTGIFRQLAESLETHGHPGPYMRHIKAEDTRIAAKYKAKKGKEMVSYLPTYMTDDYIDGLCKQWDDLAPKLKLERLTKDSGRLMKLAINGDNGKGTGLIVILNHHQDLVYDDMISGEKRKIGFEQLKKRLLNIAAGNLPAELAATEIKLSQAEQQAFHSLIMKQKFEKSDFVSLEAFYDAPYDKVSDYGKSLISQRVFAGQRGEDLPISDGTKYSAEMQKQFETLFGKLRDQLSPELSAKLISGLSNMNSEIGFLAKTELELGIMERSLRY